MKIITKLEHYSETKARLVAKLQQIMTLLEWMQNVWGNWNVLMKDWQDNVSDELIQVVSKIKHG